MKKKFLNIFMALCILCLMIPVMGMPVYASGDKVAEVTLSNGQTVSYSDFAKAWNDAVEDASDNKGSVTFKLLSDWKADSSGIFYDTWWFDDPLGFENDTIFVPSDVNMTIDLNGYNINRRLKGYQIDGEVIFVDNRARLTIKDTSAAGNGSITGGWPREGNGFTSSYGGGIYADNDVRLTLESGRIAGNHSAGAVYLSNGSHFTMNGGSIEDNKYTGSSTSQGGGVYIGAGASFTMNGGTISRNSINGDGGGVWGDTFTMNGGTISENKSENGGGVSCRNMTINGGNITNNYAESHGGGIYLTQGTINVANANICNNRSGDSGGGFALLLANQSTVNFRNCNISDNYAKNNGGAAYISNEINVIGARADIEFDSCEILGNQAASFSEIYRDMKVNVTNCYFGEIEDLTPPETAIEKGDTGIQNPDDNGGISEPLTDEMLPNQNGSMNPYDSLDKSDNQIIEDYGDYLMIHNSKQPLSMNSGSDFMSGSTSSGDSTEISDDSSKPDSELTDESLSDTPKNADGDVSDDTTDDLQEEDVAAYSDAAGSVFASGNTWLIIGGLVIIVGGAVAVVMVKRRKK